MIKTSLLILLSSLLVIGRCDLIGYNRLRNNIRNHSRIRGALISEVNPRAQLFRIILYNESLSSAEKIQWLKKLYGRKYQSNGRLNMYKRRMHLH